jgi:hypothetical protein
LALRAVSTVATIAVVFDALAAIGITVVANRAAWAAEPIATAFGTGSATLGADRAAVARRFLGGFVRLRTRRCLRYGCVIQVGIRRAGRAHIAVEPAASRIRCGTGGRHIRQEGAITVALDAVTGVVADIMVVAGRGEIDVAGGANPVGDDMAHEALGRTTTIEFRDMARMRHAVGTEIEIGNWIDRLDTTHLAALRGRIIGHAITGCGSQNHPWSPDANGGKHATKGRTKKSLQHGTPGCASAERTR